MSIRTEICNYSRVLETADNLEMAAVKWTGTDGAWLMVYKEEMSERA